VLKTNNLGVIILLRSNIRRMESLRPEQIRNGEIWYDSPHATRYLFGPNGYSLKRGEAYYQNVWILFNQVSFGVSDRLTLGIGMVPLFLFNTATPVWVTPKYSIPIKKDKVNHGWRLDLYWNRATESGRTRFPAHGRLLLARNTDGWPQALIRWTDRG